MGYSSWKTADTNQSIGNVSSDRPHADTGPIYLLQPHGRPPIKEMEYEGYGVFGGVDTFVWLTIHNVTDEQLKSIISDIFPLRMPMEELREALLYNQKPDFFNTTKWDNMEEAVRTYSIYKFGKNQLHAPDTGEQIIRCQNGIPFSWEEPIPKYGNKTLNQLNGENFFIRKDVDPEYPLKFSFNPSAVYEDLSESDRCEMQGYFFEIDDEEDCDEENSPK